MDSRWIRNEEPRTHKKDRHKCLRRQVSSAAKGFPTLNALCARNRRRDSVILWLLQARGLARLERVAIQAMDWRPGTQPGLRLLRHPALGESGGIPGVHLHKVGLLPALRGSQSQPTWPVPFMRRTPVHPGRRKHRRSKRASMLP